MNSISKSIEIHHNIHIAVRDKVEVVYYQRRDHVYTNLKKHDLFGPNCMTSLQNNFKCCYKKYELVWNNLLYNTNYKQYFLYY